MTRWQNRTHTAAILPLVERIRGWSVRLDEIHVGSRNGDPKEFSAEVGHGESFAEGWDAEGCVTFLPFQI